MNEDTPVDLETRLRWLEAEVSRLHRHVIESHGNNLERLNSWRHNQILETTGFTHLTDAFNGQLSKFECFQEILAVGPRRLAVESGTFTGRTTRFLASNFAHVITFEIDNKYRELAIAHCSEYQNISFVHGDSAKIKEAWISIDADLQQVDFAYLDAHWHEYCPLRDELIFILGNAPNAVIFIDDFRIQDDDEYGYDGYSSMSLELSSIADILRAHDVALFYPARQGLSDTATHYADQKPRGTLIVTPKNIARRLEASSSLRGVPADHLAQRDSKDSPL